MKILVVGAGHGGLSTSIILARNGFDVTIIEQNSKNKLGYKWQDVFDIKVLEKLELKIPKKVKLSKKIAMTFYPPNLLKSICPKLPPNDSEYKIYRQDLYKIMISSAKKAGVKFIYNEKVISAVYTSSRVVGVKTSNNIYKADLIIDASGVNSTLRRSLPKEFGIPKEIKNKFYTYRAYYSKTVDKFIKNKYKVYLMPHNTKGVSWVCDEDDYEDVLIGKIHELDTNNVCNELKWLKRYNKIGNKILKGGNIYEIPIERPLNKLVTSGYALVGDSAAMTIPLLGSGIFLSISAGILLANVIIKNKNTTYKTEDLWEYQTEFFKLYGKDLASKDILKELIISLNYDEINYLFESGFITEDILSTSTSGNYISFSLKDKLNFLQKGLKKPKLLAKVIKALYYYNKIYNHTLNIPTIYEINTFLEWQKKYSSIHFN